MENTMNEFDENVIIHITTTPAEWEDLHKFKQFVEDNYMFEFMVWEEHILNKQLFNNDNGNIDIDSTIV